MARLIGLLVLGLSTAPSTSPEPATAADLHPGALSEADSIETRVENGGEMDGTSEDIGPKYWIFLTDKRPAPGKRPPDAERGYVRPEARERRRVRGNGPHPWHDAPLADRYLRRLGEMGVRPVVTSRWLNAVSAHLDPARTKRIRSLSFVRSIRPVADLRAEPPPPSPGKGRDVARPFGPRETRLDYGPSRSQLAAINAVSPIEDGYDGEGVVLGFLDTQFNFSHPALQHVERDGRLVAVRDFTESLADSLGPANDNYHGLAVSSVAVGNEAGRLVGPAHAATVVAATTEYAPREVNREEDLFVAGLEWLERQGVDVVNVSLGYTTFDEGERSYRYEDMDGETAVTTRAADRAASMGVVVVASAGNSAGCGGPDASGCWHYVGSPADGDSVIAVGAITPDSSRARFSSFGPTSDDDRVKPDVSAPGLAVVAATQSGYTRPTEDCSECGFAGTSAASPLVAGVATQILEADPRLGPMKVREILRETSHLAENPNNALGWGIVNAGAAVRRALRRVLPERPEVSAAQPNPFRNQTRIELRLPEGPPRTVTLTLYDVLGREVARPVARTLQQGYNAVTVQGTNLPAGVYLYRFAGEGIDVSGTVVKAQ